MTPSDVLNIDPDGAYLVRIERSGYTGVLSGRQFRTMLTHSLLALADYAFEKVSVR